MSQSGNKPSIQTSVRLSVSLTIKVIVLSVFRLFQRFSDLPVSGVLDRATVEKMQMRRCGVPDIIADHDPTLPQNYNLNGESKRFTQ